MTPGPRPDASMSLLNDLWRAPIDGDYSAPRSQGPVSRAHQLTRSGAALVVSGLLGLVLTGAVVNLRAPTAAVQASRAVLGEQVTERTARADALALEVEGLAAEVTALQEAALVGGDPGLLADLDRTAVASGVDPVAGPGLVIVLQDGPQESAVPDPDVLVHDVDLQVVVNGLWAAGAEAVAVSGQRLTALSAIRSAGQAVLVDLVPLSPPYRVEAIGDPIALQTAFAATSAAGHLALLSASYGIRADVSAAERLELAGVQVTLRHAAPARVASSS